MIKEKPFFSRLFSYQQRENHSPLENYLIEILTYCLENDKAFRNEFNLLLGILDLQEEEYKVSSQYIAADFGRPDIVIETEKKIVLIECKVESSENPNQLIRYSSYLQKNHQKKKKYLIYLTKYFEPKKLPNAEDPPIFKQLKWHEIFTIINEDHQQITKELRKFLKANGMSLTNFNSEDLVAIQQISSTIQKMDVVLEAANIFIKDHLKIKNLTKPTSSVSRISNGSYSIVYNLNNSGIPYWLSIGFYSWEDLWESTHVGIIITIPSNAYRKDAFSVFKFHFQKSGWTHFERGDHRICYLMPLSTLLDSEKKENFSEIKYFLEMGLEYVNQLKNIAPLAFEKI